MRELTLGSLFDGIGGWQIAAVRNGITPLWSSEIEDFPMAVTRQYFPKTLQLGDITKIDGSKIPPVDIICAGSPCQDLSIAGRREGLAGERSGLFMEAIRIEREMRRSTNGKYPKFFIWENVPGAFSSNKGHDFQAVLEEIGQTTIPMPSRGRWAEAGMVRCAGADIAWRVLDAQFWGVPQRRKRIFLIADFREERRPEVLFEPESLPRHSAPSRIERKDASAGAEERADCAKLGLGVDVFNGTSSGDMAATVTASVGIPTAIGPKVAQPDCGNHDYLLQIRAGKPGGGKGPLITKDRSACLSTSNTQTLFQGKSYGLEPGITAREGRKLTTECSPTLRANMGDNQTAVCYAIGSYGSNAWKSGNPHSSVYETEASRTLDLNCGNPSCNQGGTAVVEVEADAKFADLYNKTVTDDVACTVTATMYKGAYHGPSVIQNKLFAQQSFSEYKAESPASSIKATDFRHLTDLVCEVSPTEEESGDSILPRPSRQHQEQ